MDGEMRHNTMWEHNATNRGRAAVWAPELVRVVNGFDKKKRWIRNEGATGIRKRKKRIEAAIESLNRPKRNEQIS